ncbi:MAG: tRNA (adenosine(37)-N6)-threonylcarbamoyltransferase complex dimerization subunit type 1 TsaB [Anaerolineales bacterium]|jgi:tRNA threonylcarbamoyladenosine biosynthesis protein TsaB
MLLALDTSTRTMGVSLYDGVRVLGELLWRTQDYHTVELAPAVVATLAKSNVSASDLTVLAVAIGPGSFTGLRIGLALAKGLSLANHIPVVGIPTLDIVASAQPLRKDRMAAVVQAGRGRLAVGWYKVVDGCWKLVSDLEILTPLELNRRIRKPTLVCGELTEDTRALLRRKRVNVILASPAESVRRPAYLAELGWQRWLAGHVDDPAILSPTYLHYNQRIPR